MMATLAATSDEEAAHLPRESSWDGAPRGARRRMLHGALAVLALLGMALGADCLQRSSNRNSGLLHGLAKVVRLQEYYGQVGGSAAQVQQSYDTTQSSAGYGYAQQGVTDTSGYAASGVAAYGYGTAQQQQQQQPQQPQGYASGYYSPEQAGGGYGYGAAAYAPAPSGPLEFTGNGGPRTIAGTKLVDASTDDISTALQHSHTPEPTPPASYKRENPPLTIMLYRAQSDKDYPMRNVNLGDLAGVMWYLHNEILAFPDRDYRIRHFDITRIIRYKATIWNPPEFFREAHHHYGPFIAYNAGKCSSEGCDRYREHGGVVGCQRPDQSVANYRPLKGGYPNWISLPGPCPQHEYGAKTAECIRASPGGDCGKGNPVTGAKDCSYTLEYYGHVPVDEFLPAWYDQKVDFQQFHDAGGREYDKATDKGLYDNFWDGIHDEGACSRRMQTVVSAFDRLYPQWSAEVQSYPVIDCDAR